VNVTTAETLSDREIDAIFAVPTTRFQSMTRRALLRFILSGQGKGSERHEAAFRLVADHGCSIARSGKLLNRGWWATRTVDDELAY
jgi:hypothetical protein